MQKIKAITSAEGDYFEFSYDDDGALTLRNGFTRIPNEFGLYDMAKVQKIFDDLCEQAAVAEMYAEYDKAWHPNSTLTVVYEDGLKANLHDVGRGLNLCAFTVKAAQYCEFAGAYPWEPPMNASYMMLTKFCAAGFIDRNIFWNAVIKLLNGDEYQRFLLRENEDGSRAVDEYMAGTLTAKDIVTVDAKGNIGNTGRLVFAQLLKDRGVEVF